VVIGLAAVYRDSLKPIETELPGERMPSALLEIFGENLAEKPNFVDDSKGPAVRQKR
jgi:hypothetical protein